MDFRRLFSILVNSYSEILFLKSSLVGSLILLGTFLYPNIAISGIIAVISSFLFAKFLGLADEFLNSGFYTYNALLVGLSIGYLFKLQLITIFFIIISSILSLVVNIILSNVFSYYFKLPVLSLPFVLVSSVVYLSSASYYHLLKNTVEFYPERLNVGVYLPLWVNGYLKSLGSIFFMPHASVGLLLMVLIFFSSRILFFLSVVGYYMGTFLLGWLHGSITQAFLDTSHFNFLLIAMALGGVFLIPSVRSYLLALSGVVISTLILSAMQRFWNLYGLPVFTLPFNFVTLSLLYVFSLLSFPLIAKTIKNNPEETLDFHLVSQKRFKDAIYPVRLPFSGEWIVWQGNMGEWTHKGIWSWAYDFVIENEGRTFEGNGSKLTDYFSYRKPVLSPISGTVIRVIKDIEDNPIHHPVMENNWGNYVLLYDQRGFYVKIAHFAKDSIVVNPGDIVTEGQLLGLCGNSGYSSIPHIHIQLQLTDQDTAPTVPFSFSNYICNKRFIPFGKPQKGDVVKNVYEDKELSNILSFTLDDEFCYEVYKKGKFYKEISVSIKMTPYGHFYLESEDGRVYFYKKQGLFYTYDFEGRGDEVKKLYASLSMLPLYYEEGISWETILPLSSVVRGWRREVLLFLSSFYHNLFQISAIGRYENSRKVVLQIYSPVFKRESQVEILFNDKKGVQKIVWNDEISFYLKEYTNKNAKEEN